MKPVIITSTNKKNDFEEIENDNEFTKEKEIQNNTDQHYENPFKCRVNVGNKVYFYVKADKYNDNLYRMIHLKHKREDTKIIIVCNSNSIKGGVKCRNGISSDSCALHRRFPRLGFPCPHNIPYGLKVINEGEVMTHLHSIEGDLVTIKFFLPNNEIEI